MSYSLMKKFENFTNLVGVVPSPTFTKWVGLFGFGFGSDRNSLSLRLVQRQRSMLSHAARARGTQ